MMRGWMLIGWMTGALLLAACAAGDEGRDAAADTADTTQQATAVPVSPAGTPADSAVAVEVAKKSPPAAAQDTMLTAWTTLQMPSEPWVQEAATPDALLRRVRDVVAAQMEEPDAGVLPTRMESQAADSAVGLLTHPNLADDSIRDIEFRIHMRPEGTIWRVTAVDRRERCRRGVAAGGRCA
ncbi:MAG TPA: hypothetical protein VE871_02595 [Longimicrobium sp.]|nr:hypothetical protein [Longimicrobium sp.]